MVFSLKIVPYNESHFEQLINFLRHSWAANHTVYDKVLFDWQYKGPSMSEAIGFVLISDTGINGFIGGVPYEFILDSNIKTGAGLAIWVVEESIKNSGIGLFLRKAIEDEFDITYTIGLNLNVTTMYKKTGYTYYDSLHRYIVPLDSKNYVKFLLHEVDESTIKKWATEIPDTKPAIVSDNIDAHDMESLYLRNVLPYFRLLPLKDASFWKWRYLESKGYKYLFFDSDGGAIIARIETIHAPKDGTRHGLTCLRIIEIIPKSGEI